MAVERILISGASEILKKLIIALGSEISLAWGVKDELKKLKQTLKVIEAKISDAERKQLNDAEVVLWLQRLKQVSYDADDVLDEYSYEDMRRSHKNNKVKDFFSSSNNQVVFRFKMARKIRDVNTQFDQIATDMKRFGFQTITITTSGGYEKPNRLTTSVSGDVFVGRKDDQSEIIELLMSSQSSSVNAKNLDEKVSVISIVGMGGLGKTTLAQSIYNDKSVEKCFQKKMWVCISDNFDVSKILEKIMESVTGSKCEDFLNPDALVQKVKENLEGKKYLLVLDDLWNEDPMEWNNLKSILDFGSLGSRIIVTTRSLKVASVVQGLFPPYNLNVLSEEECWSIIKSKAFSPGGASETPAMGIIGKEIAKKCGGLPLAANFFGCHMHSHRNERDWLSIRDNQSLETPGNHNGGIISILKLSYDSLPSHLKQCFSYCSLFPKDWKFNRETLVRLWIAEGFIHPPSVGGNQNSLEDIGNDYFFSLLSSSFFQDVERDYDLGDTETFKMHDLVHDLALSVTKNEVMIPNTSEMEDDVSQIRRIRSTIEGIPKNAETLRTIFFPDEYFVFLSPQVTRNKRLRVIHRLGDTSTSISSSAFKFKHMRYLDLSRFDLKDFHAESIHQLYHLQTLNLNHSVNIQNILTEGIGSLINLRHLNLSYSDAKLLPDSITSLTSLQTLDISSCDDINVLPASIGRHLQNLSSLDISGTNISELPDSICLVSNLTKFDFSCCRQLKVLPRNFEALSQLRSLNLEGTSITELPESLTSNLRKLEVVNLGEKCKFPEDIKNWVKLRFFYYWGETAHVIMPRGIENLTLLQVLYPYIVRKEDDDSIDSCSYNSTSSSIHELQDLNSLGELWIRNLENVRGGKIEAKRAKLTDKQNIRFLYLEWNLKEEKVDVNNSDMVLEGLQPHPNLKTLSIKGFPGLKSPKWMGSSSCLPNLVELEFSNCKSCTKLVGLGQLPCLQILQMERMNSVKCLGNKFYCQQQDEELEDESNGFATATNTTGKIIIYNTVLGL